MTKYFRSWRKHLFYKRENNTKLNYNQTSKTRQIWERGRQIWRGRGGGKGTGKGRETERGRGRGRDRGRGGQKLDRSDTTSWYYETNWIILKSQRLNDASKE